MAYHVGVLAHIKARFSRVEAVPGYATRGNASFTPRRVVCHWTAGPRGTTRRASLDIVTRGRTGLAGPLANFYLDREGIPVFVAAGRANHAGPGGWRQAVGNSVAWGIEAESAGNHDWTEKQRIAYPKLVAALLSYSNVGAEMACGHNEWAPTRKVDINDWPMSLMRTQVKFQLAGGPAVATLDNDDIRNIADAIWRYQLPSRQEGVFMPAWERVREIHEVVTPALYGKGSRLEQVADYLSSEKFLDSIGDNIWDRQLIDVVHPNGKKGPEAITARDAAGRSASVVNDSRKYLPTSAMGGGSAAIDYDRLAELVADKLAARLAS